MATFGFIGTGAMGGALARAVCRKVSADQVFLANRTAEKAAALAEELGCRTADNGAIAQNADFIFLGVKPAMLEGVLAELAPALAARQTPFVLVSMAAGVGLDQVARYDGGNYPAIRIMPNTPCSIGEGMILYTCGSTVDREAEKLFLSALSGAGRLLPLPEGLMDAGTAVSGCGPAFVDLFLESLADGGVACGLPRAAAQELAAQTMLGAAKLLLSSGAHPGVLKDAVCSPGGSTIQGVRTLEEAGFRGAVMNAVIASWEKSKALA